LIIADENGLEIDTSDQASLQFDTAPASGAQSLHFSVCERLARGQGPALDQLGTTPLRCGGVRVDRRGRPLMTHMSFLPAERAELGHR